MSKYVAFIILIFTSLFLIGCDDQIGDYISASSITENGFAKNEEQIRQFNHQVVKIWGWVDHDNMSAGDEGHVDIWAGDERSLDIISDVNRHLDTHWYFKVKAKKGDEVGESFRVSVPKGPERTKLFKNFLADAELDKPTKVFIKGKLVLFDAPRMWGSSTGIRIEAESAGDISLKPMK